MFDIFLCIWYIIFMKKDMFTINKNGLSYGRGYVYSLQYHLVWCTKYRKKVLKAINGRFFTAGFFPGNPLS